MTAAAAPPLLLPVLPALTSISMEYDWHMWIPGPHCLCEPVGIWQAELSKLLRAEVVSPAVKQLHHLSTSLNLVANIYDQRIGEVVQECMKDCGVVEHDALQGQQSSNQYRRLSC